MLDGPELTFSAFQTWFARLQPRPTFTDAHALFEEFRGVLTSAPTGPLELDAYLALGVRQSLYPPERRAEVYALYERARTWMAGADLHDPNLLAYSRLSLARSTYDALVVDEVQDMTPVQLALLLRTLKDPSAFLLCGDANQVVHPNFFSWAAVRGLFWKQGDGTLPLNVLHQNFRNARLITSAANQVLRIKNARFGSIDKDSTFLVTAASDTEGQVSVLPLAPEAVDALNGAIRRDARFAVIVLREEDKAAARASFQTPLLFSVQEVKGLEYDGVVLFNLVGAQRRIYTEIAGDLRPEDLGDLTYARARNKADKSLEHAKFYINALFVALTRAVKQVILVEEDPQHPLLRLLDLSETAAPHVEARVSTTQEWAAEAQRLEAQGKTEQAQAITQEVLQYKPVPWAVPSLAEVEGLTSQILFEGDRKGQHLRTVFDFALWYTNVHTLTVLESEASYAPARQPSMETLARVKARGQLIAKETAEARRKNTKWLHHQCDLYGTEHRNRFGATP
ncbi:hypothetical protein [Deinococcus multiflagellatus]|uniref:DNA helicase n=1 Tax=Deinococcus multiflagellatus TaxID=1656887 RepID=A0ABW1ZPT1_9DEIO